MTSCTKVKLILSVTVSPFPQHAYNGFPRDRATSTCTPCKPNDTDGADRWMSQHLHFVGDAHEKEPDVVFIGDSLIQQLQFTEVWQKSLEPMHSLNFGIYEDKLQNILWRVENGEMDGFSPKSVVLMGGSHNNENTAEEIVDGIIMIKNTILKRQPQAQVIVIGLLPCGSMPNPKRERHLKINNLLKDCFGSQESVIYIQPDWEQFLTPGTSNVKHVDMYDYLHPSGLAYAKLMEPVVELLENTVHVYNRATDSASERGDD